jgi:hypothetical protein
LAQEFISGRFKRKASAHFVVLALAVSALSIGVGSHVIASSNTVSGRVFQDFASNGIFDTAVTVGQATDIGVVRSRTWLIPRAL